MCTVLIMADAVTRSLCFHPEDFRIPLLTVLQYWRLAFVLKSVISDLVQQRLFVCKCQHTILNKLKLKFHALAFLTWKDRNEFTDQMDVIRTLFYSFVLFLLVSAWLHFLKRLLQTLIAEKEGISSPPAYTSSVEHPSRKNFLFPSVSIGNFREGPAFITCLILSQSLYFGSGTL